MANSRDELLIETGSNELDVMEFIIAGEAFGINVAKVRELMKCMPVKPMQNAHPVIEGIFKPRGEVITVVDLAKHLNLGPSEAPERDIFMVTEFNTQIFAFHVHSVEGIHRISWENIQKPDRIIYGGEEGVATGIADYENKLITILDFEKIVAEISPSTSIQVSEIEKMGHRSKSDIPILISEDSMLLSKMIVEALHKAGYVNITKTDNGKEAYDILAAAKATGDPIERHCAILISDIEMPQMDGHALTKFVKEDPVLKQIPVVLFSSLISEAMKLKGLQVGADEQISKPEIVHLVNIIDRLVKKW